MVRPPERALTLSRGRCTRRRCDRRCRCRGRSRRPYRSLRALANTWQETGSRPGSGPASEEEDWLSSEGAAEAEDRASPEGARRTAEVAEMGLGPMVGGWAPQAAVSCCLEGVECWHLWPVEEGCRPRGAESCPPVLAEGWPQVWACCRSRSRTTGVSRTGSSSRGTSCASSYGVQHNTCRLATPILASGPRACSGNIWFVLTIQLSGLTGHHVGPFHERPAGPVAPQLPPVPVRHVRPTGC